MRRLGVLLIAITVAGCLPKTDPNTDPRILTPQRIGAQMADGATLVLEVAENAGILLDALPMDAATKDKYDCAILRVTGIDAPSPTVTKVCGSLPTFSESPMSIARAKLHTLRTCPSLRAATALMLGTVQPFVDQLRSQPSLAFLAISLTATLDFAKAVLEGGVACQ